MCDKVFMMLSVCCFSVAFVIKNGPLVPLSEIQNVFLCVTFMFDSGD